MNARRLILATLAALFGALALAGTSAQAAVTHEYLSRITEVPASSGAPLTGPLSEVNAMTVDSGHLFVAEHIGGAPKYRLDRFDASSGVFESQIAHSEEKAGEPKTAAGVAVGHSTGETVLYAGADEVPTGEGVVAVYGESGSLLATWTGADTPSGAFGKEGVGGVAVDNSTSLGDWAKGDVYVLSANGAAVNVFKPGVGGKEPSALAAPPLTGIEPGVPFTKLWAIAVDESTGDLLVAEPTAVDVFKPTGLGEYELVRRLTKTASGPFQRPVTGVAVDGGNGDILRGAANIAVM
jgi:hypothetical protein